MEWQRLQILCQKQHLPGRDMLSSKWIAGSRNQETKTLLRSLNIINIGNVIINIIEQYFTIIPRSGAK